MSQHKTTHLKRLKRDMQELAWDNASLPKEELINILAKHARRYIKKTRMRETGIDFVTTRLSSYIINEIL